MSRLSIVALLCAATCSSAPEAIRPGAATSGQERALPQAPAELAQPNFRSIYEHVISKRCSLPSCHGGSFEPYLGSALGAYDSLVGAPAVGQPRTLRVAIGAPERSYLMKRLVEDAPLPRMPFNFPPLEENEIDLIRQWIASGALFDIEGPAPQQPNFLPAPPELAVFRADDRLDAVPPARVDVASTATLWSTPEDFESEATCSGSTGPGPCVPWVAFALLDSAFRGICVDNPFQPGTQTPFRFATYDATGRPTPGGDLKPGWRYDLILPAEATFAPVVDGFSCDMSQAEAVPLEGLTLHVGVLFPEDQQPQPRFAFRLHQGHLFVGPKAAP